MAQDKINYKSGAFLRSSGSLIISYGYSLFYMIFQIIDITLDCYGAMCATKLVMQYLPYIRIYKKPWCIILALTKPYFDLLNKLVPNLYVGNVGYDFSFILALEILHLLGKLFQTINIFMSNFFQNILRWLEQEAPNKS